jgi:hypothetical protein
MSEQHSHNIEDDDHDHPVRLHGRSFKRTAVIAGLIAMTVAGIAAKADAEPTNVVSGLAVFTSQSGCTESLNVPFVITEEADNLWTLVAEPVHTNCTIRFDLPLRFVGDWDETGMEACNLSTGYRCFEGIDTPGRLALGSQAAVRALIEVPITFARGSYRMNGRAFLWRAGS